MGAKNTHGGIVVQLENSSYQTGQEVTGVIHISVKNNLSPSTLYLCFVGKERTHWTETRTVSETDSSGNSTSRTETDHYNGKLYVCKFAYPVLSWNSGLYQGGYSIPFSFRLPQNIPGSFSYHMGSTDASISYKIHIKLSGVSGEKIAGKTEIHIHQGFDPNFSAQISQNVNARLKTWCCVDQGYCKLNVAYPQNSYHPSQVAVCMAEVDNSESQLSVTRIMVRFFYSIRLKTNNNRTHFVSDSLIRTSVPVRIAAGANLLNASAVEIKLDLPSVRHILQSMYTTRGKLIECLYTNEVEAEMEGSCMCCGTLPKIQSYMNIVPNLVMPQASAPSAPPDWHPQMLQSISLQYDPQYEVQK